MSTTLTSETAKTLDTQATRKPPRAIEGVVTSDKMNKTRVISVRRVRKHGLYGKGLVKSMKFFIHDEKNESHVGDRVRAISTRPISRHKCFRLVKVLESRA